MAQKQQKAKKERKRVGGVFAGKTPIIIRAQIRETLAVLKTDLAKRDTGLSRAAVRGDRIRLRRLQKKLHSFREEETREVRSRQKPKRT